MDWTLQNSTNTIRKPQMYESLSSSWITDNRTPFVNSLNNSIYSAAINQLKQYYDQKVKYENEYAAKFEEAKTANESRYNDILQGFDSLYNNTMSGLENMGDFAKKDLNSSYDKALAQGTQGLVNAGMANSTILPSVNLNNAKQRSDSLGGLNETLRREKLGYMNNITNNKLGFMERRTDAYPDQNMYMSLINKYSDAMGNLSQPSYRSWGTLLDTVDP